MARKYKTMRMRRYEKLQFNGFIKFESRVLSRLPFSKMPYIDGMIKRRGQEYERAIRAAKRRGLSESEFNRQWDTHIKQRYYGKRWKLNKKERWGATVVFRMLKDFEREYKDRHPGYESPTEKRRKRERDFIDRMEREYDKKAKRPKITRRLRGAEGDMWVG